MNCTSVTPQSIVVCRLCSKIHEYYVNIFISNESCEIIVEEAIQDLLGLPVTVGDGLPNVVCRLCLRKLIEFREFKNMCFKSASELRAYALGNDFLVSKIKDEDAADVETSREGSSQENTFPNDIHLTEVYITTPDDLAIGNVSHAKEELWSTENTLVVKEEANDGEHRIESDVPVNALTSVDIDPLAVDTMALKEESQEPKVAAGKGNSLGDTFPHNHIQVTEVFVPFPDKLAMGIVRYEEEDSIPTELIVMEEIGEELECSENDVPVVSLSSVNVDPLAIDTTSHAKDLWSTDNALVVKEEVNGEEHRIEGNEPMNALTSVAVDPLAVDTMALKEEAQEPKVAAGKGNSLGDTFPHNHIQVTEVFVPFPDKLAMGIVRYAEEDSRPTELIVKEEIGEGLECSENDVPVLSILSVNVDPLGVDTTVDRYYNTRGLAMDPENESDKFVADIQWISKKEVPNKHSFDPMCEENLQPEHSMANSFVVNFLPEERVKNQKNNVEFYALNKTFSQLNDWATPARNHEREQLCHQDENTCYHTDYICNYCSTRCSEKKLLALHIKKHMDGKKSASVLPKKDFPPSLSQRLLWKDQGHVEPVIQETSNISFSPNDCGGVKAFKCNECGKMFSTRSHLKTHSVVHTGVKAFKCNDCGKMFSTRSNLKTHLIVHTGVKAFKCDDCGKMFSANSDLIRHSVVHSGVKAFKCNDCGKMFSTRSNLKTHSVVHTGVKAFKCDDCGKMFSASSDLNRHSFVHSGVKAFECNDCGKKFARKSHLKTHSVVHTGVKSFKCNQCGKMFPRSGNLRSHSVVHTGVKRVKCDECGKMFTTSSDLKVHSVIHTGVKPFKCDFCGKQFKWGSTFYRHLLTHADRNPSK